MRIRKLRTRLGLGLTAVGIATTALGFAASPAQAWDESCLAHAPEGAEWTELWVSLFDSDPGSWADSSRTFSDGTLSVTISDLTPTTPGGEVNPYTIRSFDWSSNIGVDALIGSVWPPGTAPMFFLFDPPNEVLSGDDIGAPTAANPVKYLSFCYDVEKAPATTSTTASTTSVGNTSVVGSTSTVAPETSASVMPTSIVGSTTVPTEVAGVTETRPTELARTGGSTAPIALGGVAMVLMGMTMVFTERRRLPQLQALPVRDDTTGR